MPGAVHSASRLVSRILRVGLPLLVGCAARSAFASPADEPLAQVELHAGYGIAVGGNGDQMSRRPTPLTLSALIAIAVNDAPPLSGYGGLVVETLDRNAAGAAFGVEFHPRGTKLHLAGGGEYIAAPYTLWGATASAGACFHTGRTAALCGDVQLTAFIGGSDLPDGVATTQVQLVVGMVFDAL